MFKCLPGDYCKHLVEKFNQPCEDMWEYMAATRPNYLITLLDSGELKNTDLTFAAEIAGKIESSEVLIPLVKLVASDDRLVREGAILGLEVWREKEQTRESIRKLTPEDIQRAIKDAEKYKI